MANKDPNEPIPNIEEEDEEEEEEETFAQAIQAQEDHAKAAVKGSGIGHPLTHVMHASNEIAKQRLLPKLFANRDRKVS